MAAPCNTPSFRDFVAQCVGHRDWYTRPRPAPVRARGRTYLSPRIWRDMKDRYVDLFGTAAATREGI